MDAGLTINPVSGVSAVAYVRPAASAEQGMPAPEQPDANSVTPAADASSISNNGSNNGSPADGSTTSYFTIDPQIGEVIYQVVDTRTQQVVQQVPDQALLRSRAYSDAIQNGSTPLEAQLQAANLYI
jgi:hypothetical protein